ncbi:MAG: AsmA family protein [Gammaproteobacteria bacterium]|nr:AsmA family protein [Gammaproteobacteria bacterium]
MKTFWKVLLGVVALLVVLVAGVLIYASQLDPARYGELAARAVRDATGRELNTASGVHLELFPLIRLEASGVTFANASWATQKDMVRVERVRAELAWLPLLTGRIQLEQLELVQPRVFLETNADGRGNWVLDESASTPAGATQTSAVPRAIGLAVGAVHVEQASLRYRDGTTGETIDVEIEHLDVARDALGESSSVSLRGAYQGMPVSVDGTVGVIARILADDGVSVDLSAKAGDAALEVAGTIDRPQQGRGLDLQVSVQAPATKPFTDLAGIDFENIGPVALQGHITDKDGSYRFDEVHLRVQGLGADLVAEGSVAALTTDPVPDLQVSAKAESTRRLTELAGVSIDDMGPVEARAQLTKRDGHLALLDLHLNGRGLGAEMRAEGTVTRLDAEPAPDLRLEASAATTDRLTALAGLELPSMGPMSLTARLLREGGHIQLRELELTGRGLGANLTASGSVSDVDGTPKPNLALTLSAASTTELAKLAKIDLPDMGPLSFQGRLVEQGGSLDLEAIELTAHPPDVELRVRGTVAGLRGQPKPDVEVHAKADSLHRLIATLPAVGPVVVAARVEPRGEIIDVHELSAKVGKSDLSGTLQVRTGGERPAATGKLHARVLDLDELWPPAPARERKAATSGTGDGLVFPADPIPSTWLAAADADLQITADRIVARELALVDVRIPLALKGRRLDAKPELGVAGGHAKAEIVVDGSKAPLHIALRLDGEKIEIERLSAAYREQALVKGAPANVHIDVESTGDSVRALMAGLDGSVLLDAGKGELLGDRINLAGADVFSQMLGSVIPRGTDDDRNVMQCSVIHFEIRDGFAVADQSLVLETNKVLLKGGGAIDLASEQVDLGARMAARSGLRIGAGSLASAMKIEGTLAQPRLALDLKGAAEAGARVTVGVMTMGLSLVAENVYGELVGDPHPCETARKREFEPRKRGESSSIIALPDGKRVTEGVSDVTKATGSIVQEAAKKSGDLLESIGSGIKKIFE